MPKQPSCDELDSELDSGVYTGTFRWKKSAKLYSLPRVSSETLVFGGWSAYLRSRGTIGNGKELPSLSIIDCLSFPLSIANACLASSLLERDAVQEQLTIVCIGCSAKAEERVLRETASFQELQFCFPRIAQINLYLVGPEMSTTQSPIPLPQSTVVAHTFQGTSLEFFRAHPSHLSGGCVVVGFNCGFGNFENPLPHRYDLLLHW